MKAGQTERFYCEDCLAEFEVTYEPKAKGLNDIDIEEKFLHMCPFCGKTITEEIWK